MVAALAVLSILLAYIFRVVGVDGKSMMPTLDDGNMLLLSTRGVGYEKGDIVVVDRYTEAPLVKRVIAIGGDSIDISTNGKVYVNGQELDEPYIQGKTYLNDFPGEMVIPDGYLFVMGDNRSSSKDSRKAEIGLISVKDVVGEAIFCIWPIKSIRRI